MRWRNDWVYLMHTIYVVSLIHRQFSFINGRRKIKIRNWTLSKLFKPRNGESWNYQSLKTYSCYNVGINFACKNWFEKTSVTNCFALLYCCTNVKGKFSNKLYKYSIDECFMVKIVETRSRGTGRSTRFDYFLSQN